MDGADLASEKSLQLAAKISGTRIGGRLLAPFARRLEAAAERVESAGRSMAGSFPGLTQKRAGFDVRGPQWLAAMMLPFLVVIMMAVVTAIYQATIQVLVSLGLTNVAFLFLIQSIAGLGLLIMGVWALIKWTETGGFGIFRWS